MESWIEQLAPIITEFKDGNDEKLTLSEVDKLCVIIKAKINLDEGNITEDEYNQILDADTSLVPKQNIIDRIQKIIGEWGAFGVDEVGCEASPCVNEMGGLVALAEYFKLDSATVEVYDPSGFSSDSQETYDLDYSDMTIEVLKEIELLCDIWEADQIQTEKRISN